MKTATLRPGILVALKTTIKGGVNYQRREIEGEHVTEEGAKRAKWETTREIEDPVEHEKAIKVRGKCRSLITGICSASDFGLLCPTDREEKLNEAIQEAVKLANEHNDSSSRTAIAVYVLKGRIAQDDAEAIRAINSEVRDLLDAMERGVKAAEPEEIRAAANRARQLGAMLTTDAADKVNAAIEQAREAARMIVRRVEKSGEVAAVVVNECKLDAIQTARFTFLDLGDVTQAESVPVPAAGLDLMPDDAQVAPVAPAVPLIEMES